MKSQTKKALIELSLGVVAIVLFASPCYPENQPKGDANDEAYRRIMAAS